MNKNTSEFAQYWLSPKMYTRKNGPFYRLISQLTCSPCKLILMQLPEDAGLLCKNWFCFPREEAIILTLSLNRCKPFSILRFTRAYSQNSQVQFLDGQWIFHWLLFIDVVVGWWKLVYKILDMFVLVHFSWCSHIHLKIQSLSIILI